MPLIYRDEAALVHTFQLGDSQLDSKHVPLHQRPTQKTMAEKVSGLHGKKLERYEQVASRRQTEEAARSAMAATQHVTPKPL
jgi:hypothetical protein